MNVKGTVKLINATQVVSDKFSKRTMVVVTPDQYPQEIEIQFTQDKCALLDAVKVGQEVDVSINLRGRLWTSPTGEDRYFNTIEGWKLESSAMATAVQTLAASPLIEDPASDLPF